MNNKREYYIGLMSGTSLDGVNGVLMDFSQDPWRLCATQYIPFSSVLRQQLLGLQERSHNDLEGAYMAGLSLATQYLAVVNNLLSTGYVSAESVMAIGAHGQTVRHRPHLGYTIQINAPAWLAERSGISVVADFRSRDIAAGGQGAPLVPAFHQAVFAKAGIGRVVVNIGGIANLSYLYGDGRVSGFDTGTGNVLMDDWIRTSRGLVRDDEGQWSASGYVIPALLDCLMKDSYFKSAPPKSTGRDHFNLAWLKERGGAWINDPSVSAADIQATLCELTAVSIVEGIEQADKSFMGEVFLCGGGVHNRHLCQRLRELRPSWTWATTAVLGIEPDWVEATAFAWLARQTCLCATGNLPSVTGAVGRRILGAIYRY